MTAGRQVNTNTQDWNTPPKYIEVINTFFNNSIDLDPCSNRTSLVNAKTSYSLPIDGLVESWNFKNIFVNPPYGYNKLSKNSIKDWIKKCSETHKIFNSEILLLVPVATNTQHWKKYIFGSACAVCFLADTRLKFYINGSESSTGAPMACAMVYYGKDVKKFDLLFEPYGTIVSLNKII